MSYDNVRIEKYFSNVIHSNFLSQRFWLKSNSRKYLDRFIPMIAKFLSSKHWERNNIGMYQSHCDSFCEQMSIDKFFPYWYLIRILHPIGLSPELSYCIDFYLVFLFKAPSDLYLCACPKFDVKIPCVVQIETILPATPSFFSSTDCINNLDRPCHQ